MNHFKRIALLGGLLVTTGLYAVNTDMFMSPRDGDHHWKDSKLQNGVETSKQQIRPSEEPKRGPASIGKYEQKWTKESAVKKSGPNNHQGAGWDTFDY